MTRTWWAAATLAVGLFSVGAATASVSLLLLSMAVALGAAAFFEDGDR